jgi:uncharacterized protein
MEIYVIPFEKDFIIYRPLCRMAFIGNTAMVNYIQRHLSGQRSASDKKVDKFLESIGFWEQDPTPPEPRLPLDEHRPTMAVLHMTNACNLRCAYCYARGGEQSDLWMTFPLARIVIDTAYKNAKAIGKDCFSLAFHGGGEPTLNWKVLKASVEYAKKKTLPLHISMSSNGLWNKKQRKFIIEHFNELSISFDGIRKVQDSQRPRINGKGSFETVMKTIHDLDRTNFHYGIRLTATVNSFKYLPESISFLCKETQCQILQVEPCYSPIRGKYIDPTPEQADEFVKAFMEAFEIAASASRTLFYSGARPWTLISSFCRACEDALVVTPEGDIVTCFEIHDRRHPLIKNFVIGKILPDRVNVEIGKVRSIAKQQEQHRKACEGCFCYWHCGGDCASKCISSYDDNSGRCLVNRKITRELLAWYISKRNGVWLSPWEIGDGKMK